MLDSPITLILLGISAASALASYTAARRRRARSVPPALSKLSDADLLAALAALQANNVSGTAQQRADGTVAHSISVTHNASKMRDLRHPESASWAIQEDNEVRRRIALLIVEEIERRQVRTER